MPRLRDGDYRFEQSVWETFKRKLVEDTNLTLEEAKRRKAIAEMLLAEFAVDRQINQKAPEVAWHHQFGWLHSAKEAEAATDEDQISPGTWTTLPEGFEVSFEEGDFDAERGDSRARGFTALLFQDFSAASDADVKNALALVRECPSVITALKGNLDTIAEMADASASIP